MSLPRTIVLFLSFLLLSLSAIGQRWEEVTLPAPYNAGYYLDIFFLPSSPQYGWACDYDSGYVVRTTNGGRTWSGTRVLPAGQRCHLEYIQFLNQNVGYTSGPCGAFKSTDGGATWTELYLDSGAVIWGGWFRSANVGWFTGGYCGVGKFYRTTDGGQSFTVFTDTTITRSNLTDPLWMADLPAGVVYAIGNGTLWTSDDDGLSWSVVSYTGTTSPWHEELARYGNSFAIPNAPSNCTNGNYTGGGMRFSANAGQTWNNFETGNDMFGTFLLDESRAWASGWGGNVWYTSNKGANWTLRNCGIGTRGMDDIFFQNDTTGWVVGDGIFRLAPPKRTVSDSALYFANVCPDSSRFDTVWVENINFFDSPWNLRFVGPEEYLFRVANAVPNPLPACSRVMVLIEYRALVPGSHTASLVININNPDTTLIVNLYGIRRSQSAVPDDTLIQYSVRVGTSGDRIVTWRGLTSPAETIVDIRRDSGDTSIIIVGKPPINIPVSPPVTQMIVRATPRDTGWIVARFKITLAPCMRDTFITVRVYGLTPIFNSVKQLAVDIKCNNSDTMMIPVSNTGNYLLTISSINIVSSGTPAFSSLRFTSGRIGPPWMFTSRESDTLLVVYTPQSGDDAANVVFNHDDNTLTRGKVNPWTVELRGLSQRPSFTVQPTLIELGVRCIGTVTDTSFRIANSGISTFTVLPSSSSLAITGLPGSAVSVPPSRNNDIRFRWTPQGTGESWDTIAVLVKPCNSVEYVVVHATVSNSGIAAVPSPVVDSVLVGATLTRSVVIKSRTADAVTITGITFTPSYPNLTVTYPSLPVTITSADSLVVTLSWNPTSVTRMIGKLEILSESICNDIEQVDVDFKSLSNQVIVEPGSLSFEVLCFARVVTDSFKVTSKSSADVTLRQITIVGGNLAFSIIRPSAPITLRPDSSVYIVVSYSPTINANATASVLLEFDPAGENINIPLTGTFTYTRLSVSPNQFNVDTVGVCDPQQTLDLVITNDGSVNETADVGTSSLPPGFSVSSNSITVAAKSSAIVTVTCDPSSLNLGYSNGTIVLTGRTCKDTVEVSVSATRVGGQLVMQPNPVTAGTLIIGDSIDRDVTISNPSTLTRTIVSLAISPPVQGWTIVNNVNGLLLAPSASTTVTLRFKPLVSGTQNATLTLTDAERCTTQSSIDLDGRGRDPDVPPDYELLLKIDEYVVPAKTKLEIPVQWTSDVSAARIDTVKFVVDFSRLHFDIDTILSGTLIDAAVDAQWQEGHVEFSVVRIGPNLGSPGIVAVLKGVANPAIPDSTLFVFSQFAVRSLEPVDVTADDGLLIVDVCGPRNIIKLVPPTSVSIMPPHPVRDNLNFQVNTSSNEQLSVKLINTIGNLTNELGDYSVDSGVSNLSVPLPSLASGMYIVIITTNHGGRFVNTIVVTR
ncbi:MAG: choice-of-anchor D domain-containing protein [Ignavibacteria bacterium]|nr:choice-of-anchor D domain-containing protein [Ignavibacteria bacterium]